jgi:type II restriction/modification system DNA methylase subunit YeeA
VKENVLPLRRNHREAVQARYWWRQARPTPEMKGAVAAHSRFVVTPMVSKHRVFSWLCTPCNADHQLFVFARDDDYFFGVLRSRFHEVWALKLGTRLETRPRYTPSASFETFPFPEPTDEQKIDISTAAKELNELRENWLNPPEWTTTCILEFLGATDGPWSRFVVDPDARGIGTVRYPRVEARDNDCAKKLAKRTLTNLYNERPTWLANADAKLDRAVAHAYGFPVDLSDEQVLERLLALNQQRIVNDKPAIKKQPRVSRAKTDEELV